MYASGKPVQLATSYIPKSIIEDPKLAQLDTNPAQLYERLAERGHRATHFSEEIEVRRPTPNESAFLGIPEAQPVLTVVRVVRDQDNRPMDAALNVLAGLQWKLVYEWDQTPEGAP
jgi:GntR family transcriptional regulator